MLSNGIPTPNTVFYKTAPKINTQFQSFVTTQVNGVKITVDSSTISAQQLQQLNFSSTIETNMLTIVDIVNVLLKEFAAGDFITLATQLTADNYTNISTLIYNIRLDPNIYPNYELLRNTISLSFQQLYQSFSIHGQIANDEAIIQNLRSKEAILDDLSKLKEYVIELQSKLNSYAFDEVKMAAPMAIIKPEYAKYIQMYGYPHNMVFDTDKLAAIVANMNNG